MFLFNIFLLFQGDSTKIIDYNGKKYIEHKYKSIGLNNFTTPRNHLFISYLIVAGGGAGGSRHAGGGGAGGVIIAENILIPFGTYIVEVGDGGKGIYNSNGQNGQNSSFFNDIAIGGGGGGTLYSNANNGGSGGGGSYAKTKEGESIQISSVHGISYGNKGGKDISIESNGCIYFSGGGGGAGGQGEDGHTTPTVGGGNGGPGIQWIDDNYYGGGGGGSSYQNGKGGDGGIGGGGGANAFVPGDRCSNGGTFGFGSTGGKNGTIEYGGLYFQGGNGGTNTGGGGGGGSQYTNGYSLSKGGDGGSGIVIIRYLYEDSNSCIIYMNQIKLFSFYLIHLIL